MTYLQHLKELANAATAESRWALTDAYKYSPCGYHEKDFAVSWSGRHRIVERVPEEFADEIVKQLQFAITSRLAVPRLVEAVEVMREALEWYQDHTNVCAEAEAIGKILTRIDEILTQEG